MELRVTINGEGRSLESPVSLRDLLRLLQLQEDRVAIELNRKIIHREKWAETCLQNDDRLEIVQFVGGG